METRNTRIRIIMTKKKTILIILLAILIQLTAIVTVIFTYDCTWKKRCFTYELMLHDHIRYNGEDYYFMNDQSDAYRYIDESTEYEVVIIEGDGDVHSSRTYTAYAYIGDEELEYLYFNSAKYTKNLSHPIIVNDSIITNGQIP